MKKKPAAIPTAAQPVLPSPLELATLAAALTKPDPTGAHWAAKAASSALMLYLQCQDKLAGEQRAGDGLQPLIQANQAAAAAVPKPDHFPCTLVDWLRLVIGGRTVGDRWATFRKFMKETGHDPAPMLKSRDKPVLAPERYTFLALDYYEWRDQHRRTVARANARQRK